MISKNKLFKTLKRCFIIPNVSGWQQIGIINNPSDARKLSVRAQHNHSNGRRGAGRKHQRNIHIQKRHHKLLQEIPRNVPDNGFDKSHACTIPNDGNRDMHKQIACIY